MKVVVNISEEEEAGPGVARHRISTSKKEVAEVEEIETMTHIIRDPL